MARPLTPQQLIERMQRKRDACGDPTLEMEMVTVKLVVVDGEPQVVVCTRQLPDGFILDKQMALDLTAIFGPHPLVQAHFGLDHGGHS